ncbi:MAG: ABC transporter substrate-binding protein [Syntrophothermaceae bacterium]
MKKRNLVGVVLALLLIFALTITGCGNQNADTSGDGAREVPALNISYIFTNHQTPFVSAMYKGEEFKDKGTYLKEVVPKEKYELYSENGKVCKLNVIAAKSGSETASLFAQEHIDVGLASATAVISAIDRGTPIKILSPVQTEGLALVFPQGSEVTDWDAFVNYVKSSKQPVKIGYHSPTSAPKMVFEAALFDAGMKITQDANDAAADILLVDLKETSNLIPSLTGKQVDGWVGPSPFPEVALNEGIGQIVVQLRDLPPEGKWHDTPCCVVAASDKAIANHPEELRALMTLLAHNSDWCNHNLEEAADITSQWMGISKEAAEKSKLKYTADPSDSWKEAIGVYLKTLDTMNKFDGQLKGKDLKEAESLLFDFQFVQ